LYVSVEDTLAELRLQGHVIVGHTEAMLVNSYDRLVRLRIGRFFTGLYALEGRWEEPDDLKWEKIPKPPEDFARIIPWRSGNLIPTCLKIYVVGRASASKRPSMLATALPET
jgi:hypothetical protein